MTHVALLRGINVGGKNILPMKNLAKMFADAGCTNVRTYIQSGNVIFEKASRAQKTADAITANIEQRLGFPAPIILRTSDQLRKIKAEVDAALVNQSQIEAGMFEIQRVVAITLDEIYKLEADLDAREHQLMKAAAKAP